MFTSQAFPSVMTPIMKNSEFFSDSKAAACGRGTQKT